MVPGACSARSLGIVAERGANAGNLVSGDRCSGTRPTTDDAFVGLTGCYGLGDLAGDQRPIYFCIVLSQRPEEQEIMSSLSQFLDQCIGKVRAFVAADCNSHKLWLLGLFWLNLRLSRGECLLDKVARLF